MQRSGRSAICGCRCGVRSAVSGALAIVERLPAAEITGLGKASLGSGKSRVACQQLIGWSGEKGQMQVVSEETHVLLAPSRPSAMLAIDPSAVRFWACSGKPLGYLSDGGAGSAEAATA